MNRLQLACIPLRVNNVHLRLAAPDYNPVACLAPLLLKGNGVSDYSTEFSLKFYSGRGRQSCTSYPLQCSAARLVDQVEPDFLALPGCVARREWPVSFQDDLHHRIVAVREADDPL